MGDGRQRRKDPPFRLVSQEIARLPAHEFLDFAIIHFVEPSTRPLYSGDRRFIRDRAFRQAIHLPLYSGDRRCMRWKALLVATFSDSGEGRFVKRTSRCSQRPGAASFNRWFWNCFGPHPLSSRRARQLRARFPGFALPGAAPPLARRQQRPWCVGTSSAARALRSARTRPLSARRFSPTWATESAATNYTTTSRSPACIGLRTGRRKI